MKKLVAAAVAGAVLAVAAASSAGTTRTVAPSRVVDAPPISYGVADDVGKYADDGGAWFNGQPLQDEATAQLSELCQKQLHAKR